MRWSVVRPALGVVAVVALTGCVGAAVPSATSPAATATPTSAPVGPRIEVMGEAPVMRASDFGEYGAILPATYFTAGSERHAYVVGFGEEQGDQRVFHVTSSDGVAWSVDGSDPFAQLGVEMSPPGPIPGSVLQADDGTWLMYFWGVRAPGTTGARLWRATAPGPGGPWIVDPTPILERGRVGAWDDAGLDFPAVVRTDDGYHMLYSANTTTDRERSAIGMATSPDGVAWTRSPLNPIVTADLCGDRVPQAALPRLMVPDDGQMVLLWLAGRAVRMGTSDDGGRWACAREDPILTEFDLSNSEGIHTIAATMVDGEISVLVESLFETDDEVGSEIWLARVNASSTIAPGPKDVAVGPLGPGTYTMLGFSPRVTVTVPDGGWETFHRAFDFWDVARQTDDGLLALLFQRPTTVYGPAGATAASTAHDAAALLAGNPAVTASPPIDVVIDGRPGRQVDLVAKAEDTQLLRGERRPLLGTGPTDAVRLTFVDVDGELLVVGLIAPVGTLDRASVEVRPLLDSVRIGP